MAKKPTRKAPTKRPPGDLIGRLDEVELRKWCVEKALGWPRVTIEASLGQGAAFQQALGYQPARQADADIVGRAKMLREWVGATYLTK